ncbi:hypothetical protein [Paenibacillus soyae]|uniref:Uncharacterized protein n=1 Tax=Paenibacillus soyae TaxID=2969249 RepID=A0A9X2SCF1_9BACL|nr:hypothetical protein [Paenibacillus soyae]MCR2806002.1 hypothetical protein [Paenibacillus soyae]
MAKLESFDFHWQQLTPYSLAQTPTELASIRVEAKRNGVVKLAGNVGWIALIDAESLSSSIEKVDVVFEIWRDAIGKSSPIYVGRDSAQASDRGRGLTFDNYCISSMDLIDYNGGENGKYILTARVINLLNIDALVIAPLTFYGAAIEK